MSLSVAIENGFAVVDAGTWLAGRGQPAAFRGEAVRRRRKGWFVRDRASLDLFETTGRAWFADASRPFLTHIPCAAPVAAVSSKVLVAPAAAWSGAELVKVVPMSVRGALCVTRFAVAGETPALPATEPPNCLTTQLPNHFVVMATASRTTRISVADGDTLSVRPEAAVAWTGNRPTGFVRRLGLWDIILPRAPRDLMLHFHGPCVVWLEGAKYRIVQPLNHPAFPRRAYGV